MWQGPAPERPYHPARHSGDWFLINDYSIGFIVNWGVHHLDIALWGLPELGTMPFEVDCRASYRHEGFTDNANQWNALCVYDNGLKLIFKDQYQMRTGCRFYGDIGWVHVDRPGIEAAPSAALKQTIKPEDTPLYASEHHQRNFIECVRSRKDPVSNVDATHTASCLGMVADIAGRLRAKLKWDPKTEQFVGNDEANALLKRPAHNGWVL
jgi:predicted dehydrogenase